MWFAPPLNTLRHDPSRFAGQGTPLKDQNTAVRAMSTLALASVDVGPVMYVGDECRECAHSATKRLGMTPREGVCIPSAINKVSWTSTWRSDDLDSCSLHYVLNAFTAAPTVVNDVLFRPASVGRARLCGMGARLPGEHATPPAKRRQAC